MSLCANGVRPSFVVKLEVDANGRTVSNENGDPKIEIINAAINVRHNGSYWAAHNYLEYGTTDDMPEGYRAFWDQAKKLGELAGVKPHDADELDSQAIESYFSKIANGAIGGEIDRELEAHGLFDPNGPKYLSRYQEPTDAQRMNGFFALASYLGVDQPPAPPLAELSQRITPNDDRWPAMAQALGLADGAPVSQVFDRLAIVARDSKHPLYGAVTDALWTNREKALAMVTAEADNPTLQGILDYNRIRRMNRAVVTATAEGHYDNRVRRYGWLTAPMRRTCDAANQALVRALKGGDLDRAKRILAEMSAIAARTEASDKKNTYITRELASIATAKALVPFARSDSAPAKKLEGVVRFVDLSGAEVALNDPQVIVQVPIKWMAKRLRDPSTTGHADTRPRPGDNGASLKLGNRTIVSVGETVHARIDVADPEKRKVLVDLAELDPPR